MSWKGDSTRAVIQDLFGCHVRAVMLAATAQHVGKTTVSLGVFSGLLEKWGRGRVAYCKPLGQRFSEIKTPDGRMIKVDKDVEVVRNTFKLHHPWEAMSPVVFPPGYTRKCIDGLISPTDLLNKIKDGFTALATSSDFLLMEASGHIGVGSIAGVNNAQIAGALGVDVVIIAPGGLGISFDQLALNKALLEVHGAHLRGVILNKVDPEKVDMVKDYYSRQLMNLWGTPLLGCIPYGDHISRPSINGFAEVIGGRFIAGEAARMRTFLHTRLVLADGDKNLTDPIENQLVVTHSSRGDVIQSVVRNHEAVRAGSHGKEDLRGGLILVGVDPISTDQIRALEGLSIPTVWVNTAGSDGSNYRPGSSFEVLKLMNQFTQKHDDDDTDRLANTMRHIRNHVDIDRLCDGY
eukprot:CAMPEP_0172182778 /NCGR_PEP_ID=MMETSP1050-20130122/18591_1 /TAXON_ID=233186 /ORGANISM="Cryptomonas curvata, Strain CCAP979/52" /LENGTH=405 /DNA_ID=CAMNT_0012856267 /DNA_START=63 /DNA_END=1277 /DNA_ORIENTATION=-